MRRPPELDFDLGRGDRQALARPDQDRNVCPAPGVSGHPDRDVALGGQDAAVLADRL
jgi:hypothetical protein